MANKTIGQLTEATSVQSADLFLLEQTGVAKKLTGQTLVDQLAAALDGHGGIDSIAKTSTSGLVDTYTITMTDGATSTFSVKNGADGTNGTNGTNGVDGFSPIVQNIYFEGGTRWRVQDKNGYHDTYIYNGTNGTNGTDGVNGVTYIPSVSAAGVISWTNDGGQQNPQPVNIKGAQGAQGDNWFVYIKWASVQPTSDAEMGDIPDAWMGVYGGASATAPTHYTDYAWYEVKGAKGDDGDPITSVIRTGGDGSPGTDDTYTVYVNSTVVGTFLVHNGTDGLGTVNSINNIGVDSGTNNITLTASDVGAATIPLYLQATVTSLPRTISNASITATMRVIALNWGTPSAIRSNIAWTTSDGELVLSGTMSGSSTVELILIETV